jgi:hypothetical protein
MLRVKEPFRLPSSIRFSVRDNVINLDPVPISFALVFEEYQRIFGIISSDLFSAPVLKSALKGQPLRQLGRGTNTILTNRPSVAEFSHQLDRALH